jgi:TolB-like protein
MTRRSERRAAWPLALALAACGCAAAANPPAAPAPRPVTVAVFEFEDHSLGAPAGAAGLGRTLTDRIMADLAERRGLRLVERGALAEVLAELALGSAGLADAENRLRLGRLLGAQYFVFGGFTALGPSVRIDGRVVVVESGLTQAASVQGPLARRAELEDALAERLAAALLEETE